MKYPQLASPPTETWQDQVNAGRWDATSPFSAACVADRLPGEPLRLVTLCHRCGRDMAGVPGDKGAQNGGTVNVDAAGLPWCGCSREDRAIELPLFTEGGG